MVLSHRLLKLAAHLTITVNKHLFLRKQYDVAWRRDPALKFMEDVPGYSLRLVPPNRRTKPFTDNRCES